MRLIDLAGKKFGMLTVLSLNPHRGSSGEVKWNCLCECGSDCIVSSNSLRSGTKSCGCMRNKSGPDSPRWNGGIGFVLGGYVRINIGRNKRALEHREVIKRVIGKEIPRGAIPHHVDYNKSNNKNNNLVLCNDRAYHNLIHRRTDALRLCGHADWLKCCYCKEYDSEENLYVQNKGSRIAARHIKCHREYMIQYHKRMDG